MSSAGVLTVPSLTVTALASMMSLTAPLTIVAALSRWSSLWSGSRILVPADRLVFSLGGANRLTLSRASPRMLMGLRSVVAMTIPSLLLIPATARRSAFRVPRLFPRRGVLHRPTLKSGTSSVRARWTLRSRLDHRQRNPPTLPIDGQDPHGDDIADRDQFVRAADISIGQLRNMDESTVFKTDVDEDAEIDDVEHRPLEEHAVLQVFEPQDAALEDRRGQIFTRIATRSSQVRQNVVNG